MLDPLVRKPLVLPLSSSRKAAAALGVVAVLCHPVAHAFDYELVRDLRPGASGSDPILRPGTTRDHATVAYFSIRVDTAGTRNLWRTDGTTAGTFPLAAIPTGDFQPLPNGGVLFTGTTPDTGLALFRSDGSAGYELAWDPVPGPAQGVANRALVPFAGRVLVDPVNFPPGFWSVGWDDAGTQASNAVSQWVAPGDARAIQGGDTPEAPAFVFGAGLGLGRSLQPSPGDPTLLPMHRAFAHGDTLCGKAGAQGFVNGMLACADATLTFLRLVRPASLAGAPLEVVDAPTVVPFGRGIAFVANSPRRPWASDGTDAGTVPLGNATDYFCVASVDAAALFFRADQQTWIVRPDGSPPVALASVAAAGGLPFFDCDPGIAARWHGRMALALEGGFLLTDGSAAGTQAESSVTAPVFVAAEPIAVIGDFALIVASRDDVGKELFRVRWPDLLESSFEDE